MNYIATTTQWQSMEWSKFAVLFGFAFTRSFAKVSSNTTWSSYARSSLYIDQRICGFCTINSLQFGPNGWLGMGGMAYSLYSIVSSDCRYLLWNLAVFLPDPPKWSRLISRPTRNSQMKPNRCLANSSSWTAPAHFSSLLAKAIIYLYEHLNSYLSSVLRVIEVCRFRVDIVERSIYQLVIWSLTFSI